MACLARLQERCPTPPVSIQAFPLCYRVTHEECHYGNVPHSVKKNLRNIKEKEGHTPDSLYTPLQQLCHERVDDQWCQSSDYSDMSGWVLWIIIKVSTWRRQERHWKSKVKGLWVVLWNADFHAGCVFFSFPLPVTLIWGLATPDQRFAKSHQKKNRLFVKQPHQGWSQLHNIYHNTNREFWDICRSASCHRSGSVHLRLFLYHKVSLFLIQVFFLHLVKSSYSFYSKDQQPWLHTFSIFKTFLTYRQDYIYNRILCFPYTGI